MARFTIFVGIVLQVCLLSARSDERPNIVFIMTDDHAWSMMSAYDDLRASTPNLDKLAYEGMIFRNAFCTNSLCAPSRATVLTGKYSHANQHYSNRDVFDSSQQTFPKLLQEEGYETAIIGKWHLRGSPIGFDHHNILPGQGVYIDPQFIEMGEVKHHEGYVTDIITDLSIDWLKNRDKKKPFLLMYHHKAPHAQWVPSEVYDSLFEDEEIIYPYDFDDNEEGRSPAVQAAKNQLIPDLIERWKAFGEKFKKEDPGNLEGEALKKWMYQQYVKDYMRVMASVDDNVGRFMEFLKEEEIDENTVVIYTSDNGMFVGDHGRFDKRLMDEQSIRIPFVVRYPKMVKPINEALQLVLNVDYAPTILDLAGVEIPTDMQGRSLKPILEGKIPTNWRESFYYHYYEHPDFQFQDVPPHYGIRTDRFKLIHYYPTEGVKESGWEFLDLGRDPLEIQNKYKDPRYASIIMDLKEKLSALRAELNVPPLETH